MSVIYIYIYIYISLAFQDLVCVFLWSQRDCLLQILKSFEKVRKICLMEKIQTLVWRVDSPLTLITHLRLMQISLALKYWLSHVRSDELVTLLWRQWIIYQARVFGGEKRGSTLRVSGQKKNLKSSIGHPQAMGHSIQSIRDTGD